METTIVPSGWARADTDALREAVRKLEGTSLVVQLADLVGTPVEKLLDWVPEHARDAVHNAARTALEKGFDVAMKTVGGQSAGEPSDRLHQALATVSGAVGGFFGVAGLGVELPLSTMIMLRSIADIARSEGEDLVDPAGRLSCLQVFALGGGSRKDDAADTSYYAVRAAMAMTLREAAGFIAERGFVREGAPAIVRFLSQVATRFGLIVSEKAAAQSVPVAGAGAGSVINLMFTRHFQNIAHGHFTVRRLERKYGEAFVREEYERLK
ncbi:MAG: EcsC family protein [Bryobacterales bacterium]|nr:EcsC family protein [Bryobacterales bacterium]